MSGKKRWENDSWRWVEAEEDSREIDEGIIFTVYRFQNKCQGKLCKKNCIASPRCLTGLGESQWTSGFDNFIVNIRANDVPISQRENDNPIGINNLGSTCFLNSFLQLLFHNTTFRNGIFNWNPMEDKEEKSNPTLTKGTFAPISMIGHLQVVFISLMSSKKKSIDARPFAHYLLNELGLETEVQQDAQEFATLLLSKCEEDLARQSSPDIAKLVKNNFRGDYTDITTCLKCERESPGPTSLLNLTVTFPGPADLYECFERITKVEVLAKENRYNCSNCAGTQASQRQTRFVNLPRVLNILIERISYDKRSGMKSKITKEIKFPEKLEMNAFLDKKSPKVYYNLRAVLIHTGNQVNSGHYTAHIYVTNKQAWYRFSDDVVQRMDISMIGLEPGYDDGSSKPKKGKATNGWHVSTGAYMLVYAKCESDNDKKLVEQELNYADIPLHLRTYIENENAVFDAQVARANEEQSKREERAAAMYKKVNEIISTLESTSEYMYAIPTSWLTAWLDKAQNFDFQMPIDSIELLCEHGKLSPFKLEMTKYISESAFERLHSEFGGEAILMTPDCFCKECVTAEMFRRKIAEKTLKETKTITQQLRLQKPEDLILYFWVGKETMKKWRGWLLERIQTNISLDDLERIWNCQKVDDSLPPAVVIPIIKKFNEEEIVKLTGGDRDSATVEKPNDASTSIESSDGLESDENNLKDSPMLGEDSPVMSGEEKVTLKNASEAMEMSPVSVTDLKNGSEAMEICPVSVTNLKNASEAMELCPVSVTDLKNASEAMEMCPVSVADLKNASEAMEMCPVSVTDLKNASEVTDMCPVSVTDLKNSSEAMEMCPVSVADLKNASEAMEMCPVSVTDLKNASEVTEMCPVSVTDLKNASEVTEMYPVNVTDLKNASEVTEMCPVSVTDLKNASEVTEMCPVSATDLKNASEVTEMCPDSVTDLKNASEATEMCPVSLTDFKNASEATEMCPVSVTDLKNASEVTEMCPVSVTDLKNASEATETCPVSLTDFKNASEVTEKCPVSLTDLKNVSDVTEKCSVGLTDFKDASEVTEKCPVSLTDLKNASDVTEVCPVSLTDLKNEVQCLKLTEDKDVPPEGEDKSTAKISEIEEICTAANVDSKMQIGSETEKVENASEKGSKAANANLYETMREVVRNVCNDRVLLLFNHDVLCPHSNLVIDEQARRKVPPHIYEILEKYFPHAPKFDQDSQPCKVCQEDKIRDEQNELILKGKAALVKKQLHDLLVDKNRPAFCHRKNFNEMFYIVSKSFYEALKSFAKEPAKSDELPVINNSELLCGPHHLLLYEIVDPQEIAYKEVMVPLTAAEWEFLISQFEYDVEIKGFIESSERMCTQPAHCELCIMKRLEEEEIAKRNYTDAKIYYKMIPRMVSSSKAIISSQDTKAGEEPPVEKRRRIEGGAFSTDTLTDDNTRKTRSNSGTPEIRVSISAVRRSNRSTRVPRDVATLIVSSTMTLFDVKKMICVQIGVAPRDQHIFSDELVEYTDDQATLAELRIMPSTILHVRTDEEIVTTARLDEDEF